MAHTKNTSVYPHPSNSEFSNVTNGVDFIVNVSSDLNIPVFAEVCNSNSSVWKLTHPICSINFTYFWALVIVAVLLAVITVMTIFGNVLVWIALYRFPNLRSMSNCLIGNLAMSDLLLAATVLPISTGNDLLGYWAFGEIMCPVWLCSDVLYCTASIWGLCTIAVDRYTATVYPVWYHERRSPMRALVYIIFVWLFSIVVSLAPFIGWRDMVPNLYHYNKHINRYECLLFDVEGYVVYSAMGSFVIPIILMTFIYLKIFTVLRKRTKSLKPKKRITLPANESDFDSCAIAETCSQFETQPSPPVTMKDQSTQSSPIANKPPVQFALETLPLTTSSVSQKPNSSLQLRVESNHCDQQLDKTVSNTDGENVTQNNAKYKATGPPSDNKLPMLIKNYTSLGTDDEKTACLTNPSGSMGKQQKGNKNYYKLMVATFNPKTKNTNSSKNHLKREKSSSLSEPNEGMTPAKQKIPSLNFNGKPMTSTPKPAGLRSKYILREQRATKRMAIIMACFMVCWIPFLFMYLIRSFCATCYINVHVQAAIIWLGYANSGINPILYTLFNDDFRKAFKIILGLSAKKRHKKYH